MKAQQILLAQRPNGFPDAQTFRFEEKELPPLKEGEVLLKAEYISVDPYMRGRMNEGKSYVPPFKVGEPIDGGVVAKVIESKSDRLQEGDTVLGNIPWSTYAIAEGAKVNKVDTTLAPASYYLGILGMPGLTAYFGLIDIGKPKEGETVVVSGAAGAVGLVVGQIAKLKGCRVIGIAGSDEKIALLKNEFGYDEGINYKTVTIGDAIAALCPNGVDVYFDNVGGEISDAVMSHINFFARIVLCGQIALYNEKEVPTGPRILPRILTRSALLQGFIVSNYRNRFSEGIQQLSQWVKEGKIRYTETIIEGFDQLPQAFSGLFSGKNKGKMLVKV